MPELSPGLALYTESCKRGCVIKSPVHRKRKDNKTEAKE